MGVDKVILKAFLSTLTAIVLLFAFMLGMLVAFYPSTMMEITYDLGMDASSIRFAERAYDWSDDEYFIAYAMEVAIGSNNYEKISDCGEALIDDEDFAEYCKRENERLLATLPDVLPDLDMSIEDVSIDYEQYVYGQVCVAKYESGKKTEAVDRAFELTFEPTAGFPKSNAVVAVLYTALGDRDTVTIDLIKGKMEHLQTQTLTQEDKAYFDEVFAVING